MTRVIVDDDLYSRLGVAPSATADEVAAAFRSRAKELHPDLHPDDPVVAEQFKALTHANHVLANPDTRAAYDRERADVTAARTRTAAGTHASGSRGPVFKTERTARIATWSGVVLVLLGIACSATLAMVPTGDAGKTITLWLVAAKLLVGGAVLWGVGLWRLKQLHWQAGTA